LSVLFAISDSELLEDEEVGRQSTKLMTSGRLRRSYDESLSMDIACIIDTADTSDSARKKLQIFEEPEVEERVKRPMNAFMVWSQVNYYAFNFI